MDPNTVVGEIFQHPEDGGDILVRFHDLDDETHQLIEKGERYDALKAIADELVDAAEALTETIKQSTGMNDSTPRLSATLTKYREATA